MSLVLRHMTSTPSDNFGMNRNRKVSNDITITEVWNNSIFALLCDLLSFASGLDVFVAFILSPTVEMLHLYFSVPFQVSMQALFFLSSQARSRRHSRSMRSARPCSWLHPSPSVPPSRSPSSCFSFIEWSSPILHSLSPPTDCLEAPPCLGEHEWCRSFQC